ncbi:HEPN domain-containing protein [Sulfurisphaera javensis]|uniref:HEPN domain-containing protein n=1 Tax=Sulfurisphaera javensis TaxID=2049879 RepID=UPI0034E86A23
MSGIKVQRQKRRALDFLTDAKNDINRGSYDIAIFHAEEALQLYTKAVIFELFGIEFRSYDVRTLLSRLSQLLRENEFSTLADKIDSLSVEYRRILINLEDSYSEARYGEEEYDKSQAEEAVDVVEKIINELEEIAKDVKLGKG